MLARDFPFARALINSGRLSVPTAQSDSPLDTPDVDTDWKGGPAPGRAMIDAPLGNGWLIDRLGRDFTILAFGPGGRVPADTTLVLVEDEGLLGQRYDAQPGTTYLIRPDRYVAARWRRFDPAAIAAAVNRAMGKEQAC
jgi:3-(3-hydroxy-phenyl)propionate hydroxylase